MDSNSLVMRRIRYIAIITVSLVGLFSIIGSGGYDYMYKSTNSTVENSIFSATLSAYCQNSCTVECLNGCRSLSLRIQNHTDQDIELDWNKTLYIANGSTSGGFMFEGIVFTDRNNSKPPDIIFANSTFHKTIWPNNLVSYSSGRSGGWGHGGLTLGDNGVYLTIRANGEEIHEKIFTNITSVKKPGR